MNIKELSYRHRAGTSHARYWRGTVVCSVLTLRVLHGFVNTQNQTSSLTGSIDSVQLISSRFPHEILHGVLNALILNVNTCPFLTLGVIVPQLGHDVQGVKSSINSEIPWDALESSCKRTYNQLGFISNRLCVVF